MRSKPDEKVAKAFGDNVRKYRLLAGLWQSDLARKTGLAPGTISNIERGMMPTLCNAYRIAMALRVSMDTLLPNKHKRDTRRMLRKHALSRFRTLLDLSNEAALAMIVQLGNALATDPQI